MPSPMNTGSVGGCGGVIVAGGVVVCVDGASSTIGSPTVGASICGTSTTGTSTCGVACANSTSPL